MCNLRRNSLEKLRFGTTAATDAHNINAFFSCPAAPASVEALTERASSTSHIALAPKLQPEPPYHKVISRRNLAEFAAVD